MSGRGRGFRVLRQPTQHSQKQGLPKDVLVRVADESLKAIEKGSYTLRNPQAHSNDPGEIIDLRSNVENLKANTTYYGPDSILTSWAQLPLIRLSSSTSVGQPTKIRSIEKTTLDAARWLVEKLAADSQIGNPGNSRGPGPRAHAVGVLSFASARNPGGGFLTGARAQEESIVRSSTLYASLTSPIGQQFYTHHNAITKTSNDGYYSHAMIYSPSVMVFRNDAGGWVRSFEIDILTSPAVNAGVVRQKRQLAIDRGQEVTYSEADMEARIRATMKERMARMLYLFEIQGIKNVVLGSIGTGAFKNKVEMVVELWAELLLGEDSRFKRSFDRIVFGVMDPATHAHFAQRFGADAM